MTKPFQRLRDLITLVETGMFVDFKIVRDAEGEIIDVKTDDGLSLESHNQNEKILSKAAYLHVPGLLKALDEALGALERVERETIMGMPLLTDGCVMQVRNAVANINSMGDI